MSDAPRTDAPAGEASAGVEVLWEGEADDPNAKGLLRVVHVNDLDQVEFFHEERDEWYSYSHGAANVVAGHLARRLAAVEAEVAARVEAAYKDGLADGWCDHADEHGIKDGDYAADEEWQQDSWTASATCAELNERWRIRDAEQAGSTGERTSGDNGGEREGGE